MNLDAFLAVAAKYRSLGYRFDVADAWQIYQDGVGVPCGKSWISKGKKCSKDKAAFAKANRKGDYAKTTKRVKESHELKRQAKKHMTRPEIEAEKAAKKAKAKSGDTKMPKLSKPQLKMLESIVSEFIEADDKEKKRWGQSLNAINLDLYPAKTRNVLVREGLLEVKSNQYSSSKLRRTAFGKWNGSERVEHITTGGRPTAKAFELLGIEPR